MSRRVTYAIEQARHGVELEIAVERSAATSYNRAFLAGGHHYLTKVLEECREIERTNHEESKYNGWTNYATWRVNLELLDTDEYEWRDRVERGDVEPFDYTSELADAIQQELEEYFDNFECESETIRSYCDAFVADVNFYEIAENWVAEYPEFLRENRRGDEDDEEEEEEEDDEAGA